MDPDLPIDRAIARLASGQRGKVARWQLLELGIGPGAIKYRVRMGRLHPDYPGVYGVGHRSHAPIDRAMSAVLACGPEARLSHGSAAMLWGFFEYWDEPFEVTVAKDRRPRDIRVHRCRLTRPDKRRHLGVPVTSPGRTVLDCAPRVKNLVRFVNDAQLSKWMGESELADTVARHPHHPGVKLVRSVLEGQDGLTRSDLEDKFVRWLKRFDLPMPKLNEPMNGRVLDAFYPDEGVIVEIDSYKFHKGRHVFERDRDKDAEATADGLVTVRITDDRMQHDGEREARRLQRTLSLRRRTA